MVCIPRCSGLIYNYKSHLEEVTAAKRKSAILFPFYTIYNMCSWKHYNFMFHLKTLSIPIKIKNQLQKAASPLPCEVSIIHVQLRLWG